MSIGLDTLARFCADPKAEYRRANLERPFYRTLDGEVWTVATDGHRMLAVPYAIPGAADGIEVAAEAIIRDALKEKVVPVERSRLAFDVPERYVPPACATCKGSPPRAKSCRSCRGRGTAKHCSSCDCDCEDCGGLGEIGGCPRCMGDGIEPGAKKKEDVPVVFIDAAAFNARYVRELVDALPDEISAAKPKWLADLHAHHVQTDGHDGLLWSHMPAVLKLLGAPRHPSFGP